MFFFVKLPSILAKLFNFMIVNGHVPSIALTSLILCRYRRVGVYGKTVTVDDFRGVISARYIESIRTLYI